MTTTTTPTPTCADVEILVSLAASGPDALDADESARLDAHLAACAACRAEVGATAATLALAKLPPPTDADRRALGGLSTSLLEELRRRERRRGFLRPFLAGAAVAAAVAAFLVAPALLRKGPTAVPDGAVAFAPGADAAAGVESGSGTGAVAGTRSSARGTAASRTGGADSAAGALAAAWEEPDLDSLWDDTVVLDWSETTASAASGYGQASYGYDSGYTTNAAFDR